MDFNLRPKDEEDRAYYEGYDGREAGNLSIFDNPYPDYSKLAQAWAEGYHDAEADLQKEQSEGEQ